MLFHMKQEEHLHVFTVTVEICLALLNDKLKKYFKILTKSWTFLTGKVWFKKQWWETIDMCTWRYAAIPVSLFIGIHFGIYLYMKSLRYLSLYESTLASIFIWIHFGIYIYMNSLWYLSLYESTLVSIFTWIQFGISLYRNPLWYLSLHEPTVVSTFI